MFPFICWSCYTILCYRCGFLFTEKKNILKGKLFSFSFSKIYWWFATWQKKRKETSTHLTFVKLDVVGKWTWSVKSKQCKYWLCLWTLLLNLSAKTSHAKGASLSASRLVSYIFINISIWKNLLSQWFLFISNSVRVLFVSAEFQIQPFQAATRKVSYS